MDQQRSTDPSDRQTPRTVRGIGAALTARSGTVLHAVNALAGLTIVVLTVVVAWSMTDLGTRWDRAERLEITKLRLVESINASIGYDGMIHELKNYVLRADEKYADRCLRSIEEARGATLTYRALDEISPSERRTLDAIAALTDSYEEALSRVRGMGMTPEEADRVARVDDTDFAASIAQLRASIQQGMDARSAEISAQISRTIWFAVLSGSIGLVVLGFVGRPLITRLHDSLRVSMEDAHAANRSKSAFLANMSHEIRTPMTAIIGFSDVLCCADADDLRPEESARLVHRIRANADHLLTVINDVLDVSKIEAGQLKVERIAFDPLTVVREVRDIVSQRASGKGIALEMRCDTPVPERVESDPTRLRQVLLNIVGNAVKFTEEGSVTVGVSFDPGARTLRFEVADTGIGMSTEELGAVRRFEAFTQADTSVTRRFGGTGLGLRISHAIALLMGGGLEAESVEGEGSTFSVTIDAHVGGEAPLVSPEEGDRALRCTVLQRRSAYERSDARPLEGVRVLVGEDGPDNRRLIRFHLEKAGAEVGMCENGLLAAQHVEDAPPDETPDVVFMDMQMPVLDGVGAVRRLRAGGCTLPIVALTADAMEGARERYLAAGCDDYLSKPIDRDTLIENCRRWAGRSGGASPDLRTA